VHNVRVTDAQLGDVCPQCGTAANVHSIQELAEMARSRLGTLGQPQGQPGYDGEPQSGPVPGWAAEPRSGPMRGWQRGRPASLDTGSGDIGDDIAGIAISAATRFIGGAIGRKVQRAMQDRVIPALSANAEARLMEQVAIAEQHPDLRACLTDQVIFLAGGSRVESLSSVNLGTVTLAQADALVARLRDG
jgi:hypothetical protein